MLFLHRWCNSDCFFPFEYEAYRRKTSDGWLSFSFDFILERKDHQRPRKTRISSRTLTRKLDRRTTLYSVKSRGCRLDAERKFVLFLCGTQSPGPCLTFHHLFADSGDVSNVSGDCAKRIDAYYRAPRGPYHGFCCLDLFFCYVLCLSCRRACRRSRCPDSLSALWIFSISTTLRRRRMNDDWRMTTCGRDGGRGHCEQ